MRKALWISSLYLLLGGATWAQVTITGTISGTVKDSSGAAVGGAKIVILNEDTGVSRAVETDTAGHYSASSLGLGNNRVTATQDGFQTLVRSGIGLSVGQEAVVDMVLSVGAVNQTIEVTGQASVIETTHATVSTLVTADQIRDLPLNGRSVDSLALLTPGVNIDHTAQFSAALGMGTHLSINGGRVDSTLYLLDGTVVNDHNGGGPGSAANQMLGVEAVLEFRMLTHSFSAEYGRVSGAVMSQVTRSGTNQLHGSAYEFVRNNVFDARNFFNPGELPAFRQNQFGASLGGAIKKDRIFFFGNYEGFRQRKGTTINIPVPDADARRGFLPNPTTGALQPTTLNTAVIPFLALLPLPNGPSNRDGTAQYFTTFPGTATENYYMQRTDFRLSDKDNMFVRAVYNPSESLIPRPVPTWGVINEGTSAFFALSETHILSPTAVNDFRAAYNRTHPKASPTQLGTVDPAVTFVPGQLLGRLQFAVTGGSVGQLPEMGNNQNQPFFFPQNLFEFTDVVSTVRGRHSLKFGVDLERIQINTTSGIGGQRGQMTFAGLQPFLAGTATQFAVTPSDPRNVFNFGWRRTEVGSFVQDDFHVRPNLTINAGIRMDFLTIPNEVKGFSGALINLTDPTMTQGPPFQTKRFLFSPRIGLAWDPTGSGKTSVRVGGGLYYNPVDGRNYYTGSQGGPLFSTAVVVRSPVPFPYGLQPGGTTTTPLPSTTILQYQLNTPTVVNYNVEVQRQLTSTMSLRVGYVGSVGWHLMRQQQANQILPRIQPDGSQFFVTGDPVVNPKFSTINYYTSDSRSNYNSLQTTFQKNLSSGLQLTASYTWAKALSNADFALPSTSTSSPASTLNINNLAQDYGRSVYDQRQTLVVNSAYRLPAVKWVNRNPVSKAILDGWGMNGIYTYGTGLPFTLLDGFNNSRNGDSVLPDRPNLNPGASIDPIRGTTAGCPGFPAGQELGTPTLWFDPCAFSLSTLGTYGNLGRNTVTGPPTNNVNFTLSKTAAIRERTRLEFRAEFFNILNTAQFALPNQTLFSSARTLSGSAGRITSTKRDNRQIQLGLKLIF